MKFTVPENEKFTQNHVTIRELRPTDIISYLHLSIEENINIRWILGRIMLYLSTIRLMRKLLLKLKPYFSPVFLTLIIINQRIEMVGSASLKIKKRLSNGKFLAELRIDLKKEYRGLGLGSKLMEELIRFGLKENVGRFMLSVLAHNERARKLYEKYGFKQKCQRRWTVNGKVYDSIEMELNLTDDSRESYGWLKEGLKCGGG